MGRHGARRPLALAGGALVLASAVVMAAPVITVVVNGESREIPVGTTVAGLIAQLDLGGRRVAVERNREVVPRARHCETVLATGDQLEVVTFVGGG